MFRVGEVSVVEETKEWNGEVLEGQRIGFTTKSLAHQIKRCSFQNFGRLGTQFHKQVLVGIDVLVEQGLVLLGGLQQLGDCRRVLDDGL